MYPNLSIQNNQNPNRLYAIPIFGMLVKIIMLIPVFLLLFCVSLGAFILSMINSFYVLINGVYWQSAYNLNLGYMRYNSKVLFFMSGVIDKYPGFSLQAEGFTLYMEYPQNPNRLFAIPLLGKIIRIILIIPFAIFQNVINYAAWIGICLLAWAAVLFRGRYPESLFEFQRDSVLLMLRSGAYVNGLSDKYPSFSISWNHKTIKIILIVVAIILGIISNIQGSGNQKPY